MRLLFLLITLIGSVSAFGQAVDYRSLLTNQFTTNLPSRGYVGIRGSGITNIPGTNVNIQAGTGITFTTNGQGIVIVATGTNQTTITNVSIAAGTNIVVVTNGPTSWTVNGQPGYWGTNAADGSISNLNSGFGNVAVATTNRALEVSYNSTKKFGIATNADMFWGNNGTVGLRPPGSLGNGGQILSTDGSSPVQQLFWTDIPTNTAFVNTLVSVSSNTTTTTIGSYLNGHTNQIAKFTPNTNTVGDSVVNEVATNMWEYKSRPSGVAYTNVTVGFTNRWDNEWTDATHWGALELVASSANGVGISQLRHSHGSAFTQGDPILELNDTWQFEPLTPLSGHTAGTAYPKVDNTYSFGSSSRRVKQYWAGPAGYGASDQDTGPNFSGGTYGIMAGTASLQFWKNSDGGYAAIQRDANAVTGLTVGPRVVAFGPTLLGWDTFLQRGNEAFTFSFSTNNSGSAPSAALLTGAEGTGSDKAGGDIKLAGGRGTGTGQPGLLYLAAPGGRGTGSSIQILTNQAVLLTNGVMVFSNNVAYATNQATMAPNFLLGCQSIITNAAFTFLAPINVNNAIFETCTVRVTNSTAAAVLVTAPLGGCRMFGTPYVTNVTYFTFSHFGQWETNCVAAPLF